VKIKVIAIIIAIIILNVAYPFISHLAWAQSTTTLFVNPQATTVLVGESFTISVDVANVSDLVGYNIYLRYNTTVLTATQVIVDNTWFTAGQPYTVWVNSINDVQGVVQATVTLTGVEEGVSGSGDLFLVVFSSDNSGSSFLDLYNDALVDPTFVSIPHSTSDGAVQVKAHDVAVKGIVTSKTLVGQGFTVDIDVTVENEGDFTETLNVAVYANNTLIELEELTLANRSRRTITITWNTSSWAKGNQTIKAVVAQVPDETDTLDNTFTYGIVLVTVQGDVNGDKTVDMFDILKIKYDRSGPPAGPGGYDPNVDIDYDGAIDVFDILIAKAHLGQSW